MKQPNTPMSSVDKSWFRMESPGNPMMIGAVLVFENPIPITAFRRLLEERFLRFERFRQKVVRRGEALSWELDQQFDLDHHLHIIALPGKGDKTSLQTLASDINSTPLDFNRPLWQIHYVDNYQGGCALLVRIHHCIADGISLVRVLLSLTDEQPGSNVTPIRPNARVDRRDDRVANRVKRWGYDFKAATEQARQLLNNLRTDPWYGIKLGAEIIEVGRELLHLGLTPTDPPTSLKGQLVGRKLVAWAEPLSLSDVKKTAKALNGTVNDVLMTAATGALHHFLRQSGSQLPEEGIRVAVPFNLRPMHQPIDTLGNQFGLILVPLPVATACPLSRFKQVRAYMNQSKQSYQAQVTYSLLDLFGRGPDLLEKRALELLSNKASAVMTNVPGPTRPLYMAGVRLTQPMFWVPQTGGVGVGLSIFSYDDTIQFGVIADKNLIAKPDELVQGFIDAYHQLRVLTLAQENNQASPLNIA